MQDLVFEEPYEFIPPYRGKWFTTLFKLYLRRFLRKAYGIVADECRGVEHLRESLDAGHGILLAPNHCRPSDPMAMGLLTIEANTFLHSMASWHVFKQDRLTAYVAHRLGAFSIYREGVDRASLMCAVDILERATRPLVIFPEGSITRTNDRLGALMDGTAFIARTAAKRRAKQTPAGKVVVHPVALKYEICGDAREPLSRVLDGIEKRLSWQPERDLVLAERVAKVGRALLCLKEIEYLGEPQTGAPYRRVERLIDHLLAPKEEEWLGHVQRADTASRVKNLRAAILPDMVHGELSDEERSRRWRQLAELYLANQLSCYPRGYLRAVSTPEQLLETIERFEEDLTDTAGVHAPLKLLLEVGEAIEVTPARPRGSTADPLIRELESRLQSMIDGLTGELAARRAA